MRPDINISIAIYRRARLTNKQQPKIIMENHKNLAKRYANAVKVI